ncbi:MAG: AraC family transcriptional regulator [Cytophagales bacterium]|nr:AraC family transcriptional regulator [Cytophagales bacterium]
MTLCEEHPKDLAVSKYIDRYQLFMIQEPAFFKTIPNGKIECYMVKSGEFKTWDVPSQSFISGGSSGILPATNQPTFYHIPGKLICLNIKLNLNIVGLSMFNGLLTNWAGFDVANLIPLEEQQRILAKCSESDMTIPVSDLDAAIELSLCRNPINSQVEKVVALMEDQLTSKFKVSDLASNMAMSEKSLERMVKKQFNLTPKELWQVIRFQHASHKLKNQPNSKFIDALEFGYYDQSHFIKECRKITSYSPKELFSKMKLPTNDLAFE